MATQQELNDLTMFLGEVGDTLNSLVFEFLPGLDFFEDQLQEDTTAAWKHTQDFLGQASGQLKSAEPGDAIATGLERVALSGPSLTWKLRRFRDALGEFKDHGFEWPGVRPILKRLLGWMNTILGSLAKVLTSIDPVKEFKEGVEHLLPEG